MCSRISPIVTDSNGRVPHLRITMNKLIALALITFSLSSQAQEVKEVYTDYAENVQIVLTNQPCLKWKTENLQLNYAYAVKTDTGEKITGCFTHDVTHIIIQLSDDDKKHYEFRINPDAFKPRATM